MAATYEKTSQYVSGKCLSKSHVLLQSASADKGHESQHQMRPTWQQCALKGTLKGFNSSGHLMAPVKLHARLMVRSKMIKVISVWKYSNIWSLEPTQGTSLDLLTVHFCWATKSRWEHGGRTWTAHEWSSIVLITDYISLFHFVPLPSLLLNKFLTWSHKLGFSLRSALCSNHYYVFKSMPSMHCSSHHRHLLRCLRNPHRGAHNLQIKEKSCY